MHILVYLIYMIYAAYNFISDYDCEDLKNSNLGSICMGEHIEKVEGDKINCSMSCAAKADELLTGGCCYYDYIKNQCTFYKNGQLIVDGEDYGYSGFYASLCYNSKLKYNWHF